MQYTQLGKSDLRVSRICFGCWQLSPRFWGEVPLEPWRKALDTALDHGIYFVDTAGAYGDGYSEESLGAYFADRGNRDKWVLATKVYWDWQGPARIPRTDYDFIISECEGALRRLRTDCIDLWQIHAWDPLTRPDEVAAAMTKLKKDGKIRHAGVSNMNVEQMALYREYLELASLQPLYNLVARDIEEHELPWCLQHGVGVIPYSPLHRGLLTGKYSADQEFTDDRKNVKLFQGAAFRHMLSALDECKTAAEELGLTMPQLAIRWLLTHPAVTSPIVGIKTPEMVTSIVPAVGEPLPMEVWHKVGNALKTAAREAQEM